MLPPVWNRTSRKTFPPVRSLRIVVRKRSNALRSSRPEEENPGRRKRFRHQRIVLSSDARPKGGGRLRALIPSDDARLEIIGVRFRSGLRIREEVRMVRPGLYLGRAYSNRMFVMNFTLFNADVDESGRAAFAAGAAINEDCWPGEQERRSAAR